ncbi:amidase family protein, partial [Ralstonia pseudosolanacearum]
DIDARAALDMARAADAARAAGNVPSLLAGLPVSIKDLFDVAGQVTAAGSRALAHQSAATSDATAVARLRAAGAVLLGRTNMSEFAFSGLGL